MCLHISIEVPTLQFQSIQRLKHLSLHTVRLEEVSTSRRYNFKTKPMYHHYKFSNGYAGQWTIDGIRTPVQNVQRRARDYVPWESITCRSSFDKRNEFPKRVIRSDTPRANGLGDYGTLSSWAELRPRGLPWGWEGQVFLGPKIPASW